MLGTEANELLDTRVCVEETCLDILVLIPAEDDPPPPVEIIVLLTVLIG
jgi:hypothetical protein